MFCPRAGPSLQAAVLLKANSGTKASVLPGMNRCGSFSFLCALQIVGLLKITPHSYPWLEVDIGKIMSSFFAFQNMATLAKIKSINATELLRVNDYFIAVNVGHFQYLM